MSMHLSLYVHTSTYLRTCIAYTCTCVIIKSVHINAVRGTRIYSYCTLGDIKSVVQFASSFPSTSVILADIYNLRPSSLSTRALSSTTVFAIIGRLYVYRQVYKMNACRVCYIQGDDLLVING